MYIDPTRFEGAVDSFGEDGLTDLQSYTSIPRPARASDANQVRRILDGTADGTSTESLTRWLETILSLQRAAIGSKELFDQAARSRRHDWPRSWDRRAPQERLVADRGQPCRQRPGQYPPEPDAALARRHRAKDVLPGSRIDEIRVGEPGQRGDSRGLSDLWRQGRGRWRALRNAESSPAFPTRPSGPSRRSSCSSSPRPWVRNWHGRRRSERAVQFEQFFSPEVIQVLEHDPGLLEGRSQEITVLFCDLRKFTSLSQRLGPEETCRLLRELMERLSHQIVNHGGVIVDYAGDGIFAMWNAPVPRPDHAARACDAALAMQDELAPLSHRWRDKLGEPVAMGFGLNTGPAQIGNVGSSRKFKYGPFGHTVNLGSRVQDSTKVVGLSVLMTGATVAQLPNDYATRRLGRVRLRGVTEPLDLFELHGKEATPEWFARRDTYHSALADYEAGRWSRACQTLMPLLELSSPSDRYDISALRLLRRSWECLETRPESFDPILDLKPYSTPVPSNP